MKLVEISDLHLDHVTSRVSRFDEVARGVMRAVEIALDEKADVFACLGDVCDPDDSAAVLKAAEFLLGVDRMLARESVSRVWIAGNHDPFEDGSGRTTLSWLRAVEKTDENCYLAEQPRIVGRAREWDILCLPFVATSHAYDPVVAVRGMMEHVRAIDEVGTRGAVFVLGHLTIPGIEPGEETKDLPRGREVLLPLVEIASIPGKVVVSNGHYHRAQTFEDPNTGVLVHVPGSLVRLTHGEEEHEPSILVLEV